MDINRCLMRKLNDLTSEQLLVAVQVGDSSAFNELYYRYAKKVRAFAYRFVRCNEEADELTQQTFVRLWDARETIDAGKNFEAFLFTMVRNNFLAALRRKGRFAGFKQEQELAEPSISSIDHYIDYKESHRLATDAIELLPPQARTVYMMSRRDGLSHEDISHEMQISKNTVNNHIKKSLGIIRKYFIQHSPETIFSLVLLLNC